MARRAAEHGLRLPPGAIAAMRAQLPHVSERVMSAVISEVPSYTNAFDSRMAETIRNAVELALGGFLSLASGRRSTDPGTPGAPAVTGSYQLGRGEARSGRSTEALLAAFRIGARVAWRELSTAAVANRVEPTVLVDFAELVFAYIDELSAAAVAGHADERATLGRIRRRRMERLGRELLLGAGEQVIRTAADEAGWAIPATLTAVLVPEAHARSVLGLLPGGTLQIDEAAELADGTTLLLVPDMHDRRRAVLLRSLGGHEATAGQAVAWPDVRRSYERASRARRLGLGPDTDLHLTELVLTSDVRARDDLRARVLAPLAEVRPATAEKLIETLRAWLRHQGRRDGVAAELVVHPQTVRYRMAQLRDLYGDRLDDPDEVLAMTVALGMPARPAAGRRLSAARPPSRPGRPAPRASRRRPDR